jgi:hypothetical protein
MMDLPIVLWGLTCSLPVLGLARAVHANMKQPTRKPGRAEVPTGRQPRL